ncbi:MAG: translation initiation factor IF-2, partial [Gammaproteobacteria bacterium]|nr:translation initiation factor IF-2 [Gammaproteobacteria bacterium]
AVASLLIQQGTLNKGDLVLVGFEYGRVRALFDENSKLVDHAGPSIPVEILGLSGTPNAGDEFMVVTDERRAREVALFRQGKFREIKLARQNAAKLENILQRMGEEQTERTLTIVLKADVQGSAEALAQALSEISVPNVKVKIVSSSVGGINETDVNLAVASNAIIIGFNVRASAEARKLIEAEGVDIHYHSIIYEVIDEVKRAISGFLAPDIQEKIVGLAEVRDVFRSSKMGAIAGCMVLEGTIRRNNPIRVLRDNIVIFEGALESLRRFKDDVTEVRAGMECGIGVKSYNDIKPGDQIEVFEKIEVKRAI